MDKRKYVKDFYHNFGNNRDYMIEMDKALGKGHLLFDFVKELYVDPNDDTMSDLNLDDIHLEVLTIFPGKLDYYPEKIIDLLYKAIRLAEINRKVKILAPLCQVFKRIYVTVYNTFINVLYY